MSTTVCHHTGFMRKWRGGWPALGVKKTSKANQIEAEMGDCPNQNTSSLMEAMVWRIDKQRCFFFVFFPPFPILKKVPGILHVPNCHPSLFNGGKNKQKWNLNLAGLISCYLITLLFIHFEKAMDYYLSGGTTTVVCYSIRWIFWTTLFWTQHTYGLLYTV